MTQKFAISDDERKRIYEALTGAIEQSGLTLDEFIFAASDILRATFSFSQSQGLEDEDLEGLRERIGKSIDGVADVLNLNTVSVAEDIIVLSTIMQEAVNHIMSNYDLKETPAD